MKSGGSIRRFITATRSFEPVKKGVVAPMRSVPLNIRYPEYYQSGTPNRSITGVTIYGQDEITKIRVAARLARKMLDFANSVAKPGMTTEEVDRICHDEIIRNKAYPSPINYYGFPKAICTSVNEVVCHGIPDNRVLLEGDMLSIDVSLYIDGFHGDNCGTIIVGDDETKHDPAAKKLKDVTLESLHAGIAACGPGKCLSGIGAAIENVAKANNFSVVREFCGHGTGVYLHMSPFVNHFANREKLELRPGMVFTIEPILVEGSRRVFTWPDGWTAATVDGGRGAQFEHEVLITEDGVEILTVPN